MCQSSRLPLFHALWTKASSSIFDHSPITIKGDDCYKFGFDRAPGRRSLTPLEVTGALLIISLPGMVISSFNQEIEDNKTSWVVIEDFT